MYITRCLTVANELLKQKHKAEGHTHRAEKKGNAPQSIFNINLFACMPSDSRHFAALLLLANCNGCLEVHTRRTRAHPIASLCKNNKCFCCYYICGGPFTEWIEKFECIYLYITLWKTNLANEGGCTLHV